MKRIYLFCLSFILSLHLSASMITDPVVLQGIIQNGILHAGFIFEGEVISTQSYWNPEHNYIYTANQVRVINVWKNVQNEVTVFGEEQLVEVITHGGTVGDTSLSISHNIGFVPGQRGMFMCQSAVVPINPISTTPLAFQFELFDGLYMDYNREDYIISATYGSIKFECVEELYELIDPTYIADCLGFYDDPVLSDQKYDDVIDVIDNMHQSAQNSAAFGKITYLMKNAKSIQVGSTAKFSVEIWAQTNKQGMYLAASHVSLQFNELAFGSTLAGTHKVKVYKGGFLYGNYAGKPRYIISPASDLTSNNSGYGVIGFGAHMNLDTKEPIEMLQYTPVQLFIVEIEIQNCNELPELTFTNTNKMRDWSGYVYKMPPNYPHKWSSIQDYAQIDASDDVNDPMCETSIVSITPTKVNAGNADITGTYAAPTVINGDVVTINGHFFGSQKGTIKMRNTDHLDNTLIWLSLDTDYDIISWSDTQIKFRVPSTIPFNYTSTNQLKVPGSGKVKVITKPTPNTVSNEVVSHDKLIVEYSRRNVSRETDSNPSVYAKSKFHLSGPNQVADASGVNSYPGIEFYLDPNLVALNTKVKPCLEEAMNGWICATEVRFGLSTSTLNPFPLGVKDGVSTIQLGVPSSSSGSSVLANTATWTSNCRNLSNGLPIEYTFEIDIIYNNSSSYTNNYWYDETRLQAQPPILYDFYSIALHEFGHALLLNHVNQKEQIMKSGTQTSSYGFHYWDRKINLTPDDIAGAKAVVQESSNLQFSNCQGGAPIDVMVPLILNNCNMPTKINEVEGALSETVLYPNPVKEQLTISFPIRESSEVYFEIYTIDGKQIYQSATQRLDRGTQELFWNTSKISKGIYLVDLWINNQKQTLKWVKL